MRRARARGGVAAGVIAAVVAVGAATLSAPSAQAHDQLVSSTPAAGAVLTSPPDSVELVSSEGIVEVAVVEVIDFDGEDWVRGAPTTSSTVVTVPLRSGMFEGAYELRWRVVSGDGHPIDGASTFTVTHADEGAAAVPPASSGSAAAESSVPDGAPLEAPVDETRAAPPLALTSAIGLAILLAVVVTGLLVRRVARRRDRTSRASLRAGDERD